MLSFLRSWLIGLTAAALFCALATELCPKGTVKNVLGSVCGVVMALALLGPLLSFDFDAYSLNLAKYKAEAAAITASAEEISDSLSRTSIESSCETYILDKAQSLGLALSEVKVTVKWSGEGCWYPVSVAMDYNYHEALSRLIEADLGVSRENQTWSEDENS